MDDNNSTATLSEVEAAPLDALGAALDRERIAGRNAAHREWLNDVATMNAILNEAADNADLCSAYEDALERVNAACAHIELEGRAREFTATMTVEVTFTAQTSDANDRASCIASMIESYANGDGDYQIQYVNVDDFNES